MAGAVFERFFGHVNYIQNGWMILGSCDPFDALRACSQGSGLDFGLSAHRHPQ